MFDRSPAEQDDYKYTPSAGGSAMSVGEFLQRLEQKDSPELKLAEKGKLEAAEKWGAGTDRTSTRLFNGYTQTVFASKDFIESTMSRLKTLQDLFFKLPKEVQTKLKAQDDVDIFQGEDFKLIREAVEDNYKVTMDYLCEGFLNDKGEIDPDIAEKLLGVGSNLHESWSFIWSLVENLTDIQVQFLKQVARKEAKITSHEVEEGLALDLAIKQYLIPELTNEVIEYLLNNRGYDPAKDIAPEAVRIFYALRDPWPTFPADEKLAGRTDVEKKAIIKKLFTPPGFNAQKRRDAIELLLSKNKDILSLSNLVNLIDLNRRNEGGQRDYSQITDLLRDNIDKDLLKRYVHYEEFELFNSYNINRVIGLFPKNFGIVGSEEKSTEGPNEPFIERYTKKRIKLYVEKKSGAVIAPSSNVAVITKPASFSAGLEGWKKNVFYGGLILLGVGVIAATAGLALPAIGAAWSALAVFSAVPSVPLIASGAIAGYIGVTGVAVSTVSNEYVRGKYNGLSPGVKAAVIIVGTILFAGLGLVTGGLAFGLAGLGFAAALSGIVTAKISIGAGATAAAVTGGVAKAAAVAGIGVAGHKALSSDAKLNRAFLEASSNARLNKDGAKDPSRKNTISQSGSEAKTEVIGSRSLTEAVSHGSRRASTSCSQSTPEHSADPESELSSSSQDSTNRRASTSYIQSTDEHNAELGFSSSSQDPASRRASTSYIRSTDEHNAESGFSSSNQDPASRRASTSCSQSTPEYSADPELGLLFLSQDSTSRRASTSEHNAKSGFSSSSQDSTSRRDSTQHNQSTHEHSADPEPEILPSPRP